MKNIVIFSITKAVVISLLTLVSFAVKIEFFENLFTTMVTLLPLLIIACFEAWKVEYKIYKQVILSSLFGSVLLFLNPAFWGTSGGHLALPNAIAIPIVFIGMLVCGVIITFLFDFVRILK